MLGTVFQKSKLPSYVLFSLTFSKNTNIISLPFSKYQRFISCLFSIFSI